MQPAQQASRTRYGVVAFAMAPVMITYIDRVAMAQAAPLISKEFSFSATQMGWLFSAFGIAYTLFEILSGWMADRFGPRKVLTRIVIRWSFFTAATGWTWDLLSLLATLLLRARRDVHKFDLRKSALLVRLPLLSSGAGNPRSAFADAASDQLDGRPGAGPANRGIDGILHCGCVHFRIE